MVETNKLNPMTKKSLHNGDSFKLSINVTIEARFEVAD